MNKTGAWALSLLLPVIAAGAVWARGGGGCLERGTPILTPAGPVAVEQLRPGDAVWSVTGSGPRAARVQSCFEVFPVEYLELTAGAHTLHVTAEHPVQTAPGVFRAAGKVQAGDLLWAWDRRTLIPVPVTSVTRISSGLPAYNLLVSPGGTYIADGLVVHNKGCFLPETPILLPDGRQVSIRDVRTGDRVLAFTAEGTIVHARVHGVLTLVVDDYVIVTTERMTLRVTPDHPFYVGDGTFRTPAALGPKDVVWSYDGLGLSPQRIVGIEPVHARTRVYNLQTDAPHTFFASGIAVHNKGGGGGGGFSGGGHWGGGSSGHSSRARVAFRNPTLAFLFAGLAGMLLGGVLRIIAHHEDDIGRQFLIGALIGGASGPLAVLAFMLDDQFGIWVLILGAVFALSGKKQDRKDEDLDFVYSPAAVARKADKTQQLLQFLARQDSSVEPESLRRLTRETFLRLQQCWEARDYSPMQPLMMPDLYTQHCAQIRGMVQAHEINRIADLEVERIDLVGVRYTDRPDSREFTALVTARARDYYEDDRTGTFLRGDRSPARFQEFWTFHHQGNTWLLRDVEQSRESDVLKEENFVEMFTDRQLQAVYLEAAGREGPAGPWLEKEVEAKATRIERLLNFLVQTDKLWDQKLMKERARQVFTGVYLARQAGDPAAVKADELFPEAAAHLQAEIRARAAEGVALEYRNLCVRKVELILVRNFDDRNADEFTARISAHAQRVVRRNGGVVSQDEYVAPFEEYWTFGRRDGRWKLKEVLPPARGRRFVAEENLDQGTSAGQLQWFYRHGRAG